MTHSSPSRLAVVRIAAGIRAGLGLGQAEGRRPLAARALAAGSATSARRCRTAGSAACRGPGPSGSATRTRRPWRSPRSRSSASASRCRCRRAPPRTAARGCRSRRTACGCPTGTRRSASMSCARGATFSWTIWRIVSRKSRCSRGISYASVAMADMARRVREARTGCLAPTLGTPTWDMLASYRAGAIVRYGRTVTASTALIGLILIVMDRLLRALLRAQRDYECGPSRQQRRCRRGAAPAFRAGPSRARPARLRPTRIRAHDLAARARRAAPARGAGARDGRRRARRAPARRGQADGPRARRRGCSTTARSTRPARWPAPASTTTTAS